MYKIEKTARPCRNFQALNGVGFTDPKDGKAKFAFVSFANYNVGRLFLVEPKTNEYESYDLPYDNGAWAIANYKDEGIIIGTCAEGGYVHHFDLAARTYVSSLRANETYIWNLTFDGKYFYGGTCESATLLRYDPEKRELTDLGRAEMADGNIYSRNVAYVPGYIIVDVGMVENKTLAYRLSDGKYIPAEEAGVTTTAAELLKYTEPRIEAMPESERARIQRGLSLPDGSLILIEGQDYVYYEGASTDGIRRLLPGEAPNTAPLTIAADENGMIWGASNFGMTIFSYDPKTGENKNYPNVTARGGGQVYGIAPKNGKIYMTSYAGGDHHVYDTAAPWDTENDINPRILYKAAPDYIRPHTRSYLGPDGNVWTGWFGPYGAYSGALSKIDTATHEVTVYPTGDRTVIGIAMDESYIYYVTNGNANGLPNAKGPFKLAAVDTDGVEQKSVILAEDIYPCSVFVNGGDLLVWSYQEIVVCDKETLREKRRIADLRGGSYLAAYKGKLIAFSGNGKVYEIDPMSYDCKEIGKLPAEARSGCIIGDTLYFISGLDLWKITVE